MHRFLPRKRTAYHEAGHLIVALAVEFRVVRAEMTTGERVDPYTTTDDGVPEGSPAPLHIRQKWLLVYAAGMAGERRYEPCADTRFSCSGDFEKYVALAAREGRHSAEVITREWERSAETAGAILESFALSFERVANALCVHARMTGDEVLALVDDELR